MGYYISPKGCSKEEWLKSNANEITVLEAKTFIFDGKSLPICLVDNGPFTAAGIAYDFLERDAFLAPDNGQQRPRKWYKVEISLLAPWYKPD